MASNSDPASEVSVADLEKRLNALEISAKLPSIQAGPIGGSVSNSSNNSLIDALSGLDPIKELKVRIARAPVSEQSRLIDTLEILIKLEEDQKEKEHSRDVEILEGKAKVGMSAIAVVAGTGLTALSAFVVAPAAITVLATAGLVCIGAGLYNLAPDFIMKNVKITPGDGK